MTKVKVVSRSIIGGSATAIKKKANGTTPSPASKGIKKNRTIEKVEKINIPYINNYLEIQSKVRLCFINLKRDSSLICNKSVSVNEGNSNKQLATSENQCTDCTDGNEHSHLAVTNTTPITAETNTPDDSPKNKSLSGYTAQVNDGNNNKISHKRSENSSRPCALGGNKKDDVFKMQGQTANAVVLRKCVVKLQKLPMSRSSQEMYARDAAKDALLASQIISPTLDHEKRNAFRKLSLSMHYNQKDNDANSEAMSSKYSQKTTSLQKQKAAFSSANKSTYVTKKYQPQRNSITSKQPTITTKMEHQKENRIPHCKANGSSKKNLTEKQYIINTSSSSGNENQIKSTTRYEFRNRGQLSNVLKTNNVLASDKFTSNTNNGLRGMPLNNKAQNFSLSKTVELHRTTRLNNSNIEIVSNSKLKGAKNNKETKNVSQQGIRIENNFKDNPPSTCEEDQIDKVPDNCVTNNCSESPIEKESFHKSLSGDKENTIKHTTCKAVKAAKKCLGSEKSSLNSNNVENIAASTSLNKDLQPLSTSKDDSTHGNGIEKDAPKMQCIKLPASSSTRKNNNTDPKLYQVKGKEYKIQNTSKMVHFLPQINSTMHPDEPNNKHNAKGAGNHDKIKIDVRPKPPIQSTKVKNASKQRQTSKPVTNTKAPSLRTANKIINTPTILDFNPQRNSTMHFEHLEHLSVIESIEDDAEKEAGAQDNRITEVSHNISHSNSTTGNHTKATNRTNKFFHRHETEASQRTETVPTKHMDGTNIKNSRYLPKRSSQVRREKVYDFLSQSQTSDSDCMGGGTKHHKPTDPTADIIKKLIAEGKVTVATSRKGKGKPVLKRNSKKKQKTAISHNKVMKKKTVKAVDKKGPSKNITEKLKTPAVIETEAEHFGDDHFMDNDDDVILTAGEYYSLPKPSTVESAKKGLSRNHNADQEGTFSNLARSVIINQAGRNDSQRLKAQRLLAMAKNLISTPKTKNIPSIRTTLYEDFSPIPPMIQPRSATKPSPWRVDEDAHLPRVFNFSRSSGNLPSFSSDFIPPTPRKEKQNSTNKSNLEVQPAQIPIYPLPIIEGVAPIPSQFSTPFAVSGVNSSIPSFSSNDSNAENKTPPRQVDQCNDENAKIFNLKQLPNPRRALSYRSPLKVINIIEVVQLPPLEMSKVPHCKESSQIAAICNNKNLSKIERSKSVNVPNEDLFGFEDFLSQTEHSSPEDGPQAATDVPTTKEPTNTINDKRHGLRKFKPDTTELQICLQRTAVDATEKIIENNKNLFLDAQFVSKPQKTVKQMLCSTMFHEKPTSSRNALEKQRDHANYRIEEESNISGMLFRDIEPETTFNEENPHRTYIRPLKRKRRLKEDRIIYAFESDESDNEGNDSAGKNKSAHNQSRETDTSFEKQPLNKRKKKQRKEKPELMHFVEVFNEMCKEVENYKLIVEKSA